MTIIASLTTTYSLESNRNEEFFVRAGQLVQPLTPHPHEDRFLHSMDVVGVKVGGEDVEIGRVILVDQKAGYVVVMDTAPYSGRSLRDRLRYKVLQGEVEVRFG